MALLRAPLPTFTRTVDLQSTRSTPTSHTNLTHSNLPGNRPLSFTADRTLPSYILTQDSYYKGAEKMAFWVRGQEGDDCSGRDGAPSSSTDKQSEQIGILFLDEPFLSWCTSPVKMRDNGQ